MTGAIKHMERSHRSHSKNNNRTVFVTFNNKAKVASYRKEQRKAMQNKQKSFGIKELGKRLTAMIKGGK